MSMLSRRACIVVFLVFAISYFVSTLIRAITATLSPALTQEFALNASDLGLLAGGYFLGFALTQLPLGRWLDRYGPRRVSLCFLVVAVLGCLAFAGATSFSGLLWARMLCGVGLSACLMAPLTGYRRWFPMTMQVRANSWMLMTGSMGLVASTLPVQWLLPVVGWRVLFVGLALLVVLAMLMVIWVVPAWESAPAAADERHDARDNTYREIWQSPYFRKMAPVGFVNYGGLLAIQTLWAAPWMMQVSGYSAEQAATGLFWINVSMLGAFWTWGLISPWLARKGLGVERMICYGLPLGFIFLALEVVFGQSYPAVSPVLLALFCLSCTTLALAQSAVGLAFPAALAGRALSAYNLVIFVGVFCMQWGIGLLIDGFVVLGWPKSQAFQGALTVFLAIGLASYLNFVARTGQERRAKTYA